MSTTTAATDRPTLDISTTARVPFWRLIKVELRKSSTPAPACGCFGITAFLAARSW